jgi:hypothetical protein
MPLKRHWVVVLLGIAIGVTSACRGTEPQFTGFVTHIERGTSEGEARIFVESHAHKMVHRHVLIVTPKTAILKHEGDFEKPVSLNSLKEKDWVKVWFAGRKKSSYPIEVIAKRILIVNRL